MAKRWRILAALVMARTSMGFQFQSVPAVAPELTGGLGMSYAMFGTLIGLYLLPGVLVALPGGWLGQRLGDQRVVLAGLALMAAGGALIGFSAYTPAMMAGRLISGAGAVMLNVLLAKMVADWFAEHEREVVAAMGLLLVGWPLGISLAMVLLPGLSAAFGWPVAMFAAALAAAVGFALVRAVYEPPPATAADAAGIRSGRLSRREFGLATIAGLVWTFYNVGLITILSFAPDFLVAGGESKVASAATVSLVSWLIMPSLVAGGWLAGRIGWPDLTMAGCFAATAALIWATPAEGGSVPLFAAMGLIFGPPAALIMLLPVEAVPTERRAMGMGVYFTWYYLGMAGLAPLAGLARDLTGTPTAPLWFAGAMLVAALAALVGFRLMQRGGAPVPAGG